MKKILIAITLIMFLFSCATIKNIKNISKISNEIKKEKYLIFNDSKLTTSTSKPKIVSDPERKIQSNPPVISAFHNRNDEVLTLSLPKNKAVQKKNVGPNIINITNNRVYKNTTQMGNVVYKIPDVMLARNSYQVLVRISKSEVNIYEEINGDVKHSVIPITETMQVNLIDDSPTDNRNFDIVKDNDSIQLVDTNETITQWSWNVTPLKIGTGKLKVVISVIRDGNKKDVVYVDDVTIKMDLPKQISFWVNKYWQWLITTVIIPFIIWLYKKFKKEDNNENI